MPNKKKKYVPPINVADKAAEVFSKLENEGFNEVDTLVLEKESCWHEQYAIFIADFDFDIDDDISEGAYVTPASFDEYRFRKDFTNYLKSEFPGCVINISCRNTEFEIIGPNYKEFYERYFDDLEAGESTHSGHWVFQKPKRVYKR